MLTTGTTRRELISVHGRRGLFDKAGDNKVLSLRTGDALYGNRTHRQAQKSTRQNRSFFIYDKFSLNGVSRCRHANEAAFGCQLRFC